MAASVFCCLRCCRDGGTGHIPLKEMPAVQLDTQHMGKGPPFPRPNGPRRVWRGGSGAVWGREDHTRPCPSGRRPPLLALSCCPRPRFVSRISSRRRPTPPRPCSVFRATQPCLLLSSGAGCVDLPTHFPRNLGAAASRGSSAVPRRGERLWCSSYRVTT